jgi:hypothetical protein
LETNLKTAVAAACYRIAKVVIRKWRANAHKGVRSVRDSDHGSDEA